jgi:precorrin-3B synthase
MNAALRRGACPSLSAPMPTGDGLLVRLNPVARGLSPATLAGLAEAAGRRGNGVLEVTARGSLQVRGLTPDSAEDLAAEVDRLGIAVTTGVPVETGPLGGLDPDEIADPSPFAEDIRRAVAASGLSARLGPKVSVVVDGGGRIHLDGVIADVRLTACRDGDSVRWRVDVGATERDASFVGMFDRRTATEAVVALLRMIAAKGVQARGRDLSAAEVASLAADPSGPAAPFQARASSQPIGSMPLSNGTFALGLGLPFGQILSGQLAGLASAASAFGATEFRLAPGRALLVLGLDRRLATKLQAAALSLGFVTDPDDPRSRIAACPGAPACASGHLPSRALAASIAEILPAGMNLHISGCAKRCAEPAVPSVALVGTPEGCDLHIDREQKLPLARVGNDDVLAAFQRVATLFGEEKQAGEGAYAFFRRAGTDRAATTFQQGPQ